MGTGLGGDGVLGYMMGFARVTAQGHMRRERQQALHGSHQTVGVSRNKALVGEGLFTQHETMDE